MMAQSDTPKLNTMLKTISWLFIIYMLAILIAHIVDLISVLSGNSLASISQIIPTIIFQAFMIILFLSFRSKLFETHKEKGEVHQEEELTNMTMGQSIRLWYLTWSFIIVLAYLISFLLQPVSNGSSQSVYTSLVSNNIDLILFIFSAVILAPIAEELLFRKLLIERFETGMSSHSALVLSALLFSMVHWLADFLGSSVDATVGHIFATFILGLVLGHVYQRTRDVRYNMFIHGLNNAISGISLAIYYLYPFSQKDLENYNKGLPVSSQVKQNIAIISVYNIIFLLFGGIAILWLIIRILRNRREYYNHFKVGLTSFFGLFKPVKLYALLYGFFGIVLLPLIFVILVPNTSMFLAFLGTTLGYWIVLALSFVIITRN